MSKVTPQPKIGFVSLGCPKNLVDSERILTELRTEGYDVVPSYDDADMVIVNTCGFIDSAVQESLEAIGEALNENGKVIVTGCLGAKEDQIREVHPKVLEITGPHSYEQVLEHVHHYVPKPKHNPFATETPIRKPVYEPGPLLTATALNCKPSALNTSSASCTYTPTNAACDGPS